MLETTNHHYVKLKAMKPIDVHHHVAMKPIDVHHHVAPCLPTTARVHHEVTQHHHMSLTRILAQ